MAFIDKVTTMRRMALIPANPESSGVIEYEGVNIEGTVLLQAAGSEGRELLILESENVREFSNQTELEEFLHSNGLKAVYQDPDNEEYWEPRAEIEVTTAASTGPDTNLDNQKNATVQADNVTE